MERWNSYGLYYMQLKTLAVASHFQTKNVPHKWLMTDGRWQMEKSWSMSGKEIFLMLQQHLLREPIQIVAIWKTVVIGSLIVEWTYPNGTRFHPWGTNLRTISLHIQWHPLQIPHISMSYILYDRKMWVCGIYNCAHAVNQCAEVYACQLEQPRLSTNSNGKSPSILQHSLQAR